MALGLGSMQLLPIGRKQVLATAPYERSVVRRSGGFSCRIANSEPLQVSQRRSHSLEGTSNFLGKFSDARSRRPGIVLCSESSLVDSVSEPVHDLIDATNSASPPASVLDSFAEVGIEVVRSIQEAENEVLKAVSARGDSIGISETPIIPVLDVLLAEDYMLNGQTQLTTAGEQPSSAVSAQEESIGILETPIIPVLDVLSADDYMLNGQTQLLTVEEQSSSAVAASRLVSEVANVLKTLERDGNDVEEIDMANMDEAELSYDNLLPGIQPITSAVETSLKAPEMVESLLHANANTTDISLFPAEKDMDQGSASIVEPRNIFEQLREIVVFAGPALGIWLSGPIMSLIDTSVIGNSSSLELAALGPGTVLCDSFCFIFMFLSVATSNLVATALAEKNREEAEGHLSRLVFVSLACGIGMFCFTWFGATPLMTAFVGAKNAALVPAALPYVQIRALAWPAVLVGMVAQSASLGMQDSWAPLKVLAIASSVNLVGDVVLCSLLGYGIAGAAWATSASQYVGVILMLKSLNDKGYNPLAISLPSLKELTIMVNLAAPILLTMLSKVCFYTLITYLATSLGAVTLAAHQVMIGVYSLCTVWGEPLAQTAQSFMPELICGVNRNLQKARDLLKSLMMIGTVVGITLGCCAISVPWLFPQFFTKDLAIIAQMRSVSVPFFVSLMITPPTLSLEGTLLAGRDMKFLGLSMASCFVGGGILLLAMHRLGLGLQGSWWALASFQWCRFFQAFSRLHSSRSVLADPVLSHEEGSLLKTA